MDANALTPRDLFDQTICYEIPPFQRPYVWSEEDQWQPLWNDIERVVATAGEVPPTASSTLGRHFLGAVVLKQLPNESGDPTRRSVIDGQQRLTTLQLLLDAAQLVVEQFGEEEDAETLQELVANAAKRFKGTSKRFKLWPSRIDRAAFVEVMDNTVEVTPAAKDSRIFEAHEFFARCIRDWANVTGDPDKARARLATLTEVLQHRLQIVAIDLGDSDDDQLIFETLNDRGTPLLAADLIKNFVFQRCEELGADVDTWVEDYWQDFDGDWWRNEVSQGRLYRSRIDLFLQYWLTMRTKSEIPTDSVFARFREYARPELESPEVAEAFLAHLRTDADTFRDLTELSPDSAPGRFYFRVVEALELGAMIPVLLWLISDNHKPPADQVNRALQALESWAVRRTLLRYTMKGVNTMVVSLLTHLHEAELSSVGDATVEFLASQDADARLWPRDSEVLEALPMVRLYGNVKQSRLRTVLSAIELHLREGKHESVSLPNKLDIEHVMPRGWREHWGTGLADDPIGSAERDRLIHTLGNLTLATQKLNVALSNRPWTNSEAAVVAPTGKEAGVGKRSLLERFSLLVLNKEIVIDHPEAWTDDDIRERGRHLAEQVCEIWPRG